MCFIIQRMTGIVIKCRKLQQGVTGCRKMVGDVPKVVNIYHTLVYHILCERP